MGKSMRFILLVLCLPLQVWAQSRSESDLEKFLGNVHLVDDFIMRFNEDPTIYDKVQPLRQEIDALSKQQLKRLTYGRDSINRALALLTLFDRESVPRIGREEVTRFILEVTDPKHPFTLDFYQNNWFAEVQCNIVYEGKPQELTLVLSNIAPDKQVQRSSWVLFGCKAPFFALENNSEKRGINPGSHEIGFINLQQAFSDKNQVTALPPVQYKPDDISLLLYALKKGEITFQHVKQVKYHFLQVPGWIFSIDYLKRNTTPSGWMITSLTRADENMKSTYRNQKLFIR